MNSPKTKHPVIRFFRSIHGKLLLYYLPLSLVPLILVSFLAYTQARDALQQSAGDKLEAVRAIKKTQIEDYLKEREAAAMAATDMVNVLRQQAYDRLVILRDTKQEALLLIFDRWRYALIDLASNPDLLDRYKRLSEGFNALGANQVRELYLDRPDLEDAGDQSIYSAAHAKSHWSLANYVQINAYEDILFVDLSGFIIYTVKKGPHLGLNIAEDPGSSLAMLYEQVKTAQPGQAVFTDVGWHDGQIALFMGAPMYDRGTLTGFLIYQLPLSQVDEILHVPGDMAQAGEIYLVGSDHRMRSNSLLDPKNHSVAASMAGTVEQNGVYTTSSQAALAGQSDVGISLNYRGLHTVCAYAPLRAPGLNWAIIAEEYVAEAIVPQVEGTGMYILTQYAQRYGYQDMILMAKDGYVFHTMMRGPDYRTNLLIGPYRDTHLGQLVQEVLRTGTLAFADFAPYLPAGNKPVAYVAAPVMYQGRPDMVVALQLPPGWTDEVMGERTGMGRTGETLLVGHDKRMRSNSYLDPAGHSVEASFVGTVERNGIDNNAVRQALAGVTGNEVLFDQDYLGNQVIVAYAPVRFGDENWALIAKQNVDEAFSLVNRLTFVFSMAISLAALMVVMVTLWAARRISTPIFKLAGVAQSFANGNLKAGIDLENIHGEELSILADSFSRMATQLVDLISGLEQKVQERTAQLEAANKELESFSYSVSHDLRAPLRAIDGYTRMLVDEYEPTLGDEGKRVCGVIREQTQRMGILIDELLAFSRLGRTQMQNIAIDMAGMARDIFDELTTPPDRARIELHLGSIPPAIGDPAMIRQVWVNLIANAIKYSSRRERAVIEMGSQQDGRETVYFVRDNGAGFDMQYANKLFGVFQRLHSDREFSGTGVGLAIVQRIIQRHHGRVWAEAKVDQGATFYFTISQVEK